MSKDVLYVVLSYHLSHHVCNAPHIETRLRTPSNGEGKLERKKEKALNPHPSIVTGLRTLCSGLGKLESKEAKSPCWASNSSLAN